MAWGGKDPSKHLLGGCSEIASLSYVSTRETLRWRHCDDVVAIVGVPYYFQFAQWGENGTVKTMIYTLLYCCSFLRRCRSMHIYGVVVLFLFPSSFIIFLTSYIYIYMQWSGYPSTVGHPCLSTNGYVLQLARQLQPLIIISEFRVHTHIIYI